MSEESTTQDFLSGPVREQPKAGNPLWRGAVLVLSYITFGMLMLFFISAIAVSINPSWGSALAQQISPYFFVLLLGFQVPTPFPLIIMLSVLFALYAVLFGAMVYDTHKHAGKDPLDAPVGYLVMVGTAVLLIVALVTNYETSSGTPVGGGGVTSLLQTNPLLGYTNLIYAPFVEELGFRIIPIGLYCFFLVVTFRSQTLGRPSMGDALLSFIIPGRIREKYGIKWFWADWVMILATSIIFGYAHIFFGAWDWGKFIPVFITGLGLGVAFLKFGAYVDIPFHWFFNGVFTVIYLDSGLTGMANDFSYWVFFVGVIGIVAIIAYLRRRGISGRSASPQAL